MNTPTLGQIILEPERARDVPVNLVALYLGNLAHLIRRAEIATSALAHRLPVVYDGKVVQTETGDRLLSAKEAAAKIGRSVDWLYDNASKLPFTVRNGRTVQFSEQGIERWITAQQRKGARA